jgi:tRNA threonylcarbamoyladenosine biosynthesis protein TsaE
MYRFSISSRSPEQTEQIAACLANHLPIPVTIALEGDLGAGKTCFVRGLASAFGGAEAVSSPTYALAQTYPTQPPIHHLDLYRVKSQDLEDLGLQILLEDPAAIICVEWPQARVHADIGVVIASGAKQSSREVKFEFSDRFSKDWVLTLERDLLACLN